MKRKMMTKIFGKQDAMISDFILSEEISSELKDAFFATITLAI